MRNREPFDYIAAFGLAVAVGPLPLVIILSLWMAVGAFWYGEFTQAPLALLFGVPVWVFSVPVWGVGLLVLGVPVWWTIRRLGGGGRLHAILAGAILVGGSWALALSPGDLSFLLLWTIVGVLSGGLAGDAGWRAGRPKPEVAS